MTVTKNLKMNAERRISQNGTTNSLKLFQKSSIKIQKSTILARISFLKDQMKKRNQNPKPKSLFI